ncbi:glycosyl hydrolase family 95 catalytic domain-containing protein [Cohnella thermotolerans]|uniref:glycoside hydrolase family 95 protein n=1 Tax=Cohnella thermotolerans TaxID=329858 RepID=UPI00040F2E0D|nr:glycoside hydrolase family 95 protein [Cohnella thermotolerans]
MQPVDKAASDARYNEMKLRYETPALEWSQGLPLGNGRLGIVLHGDAGHDRWTVTESTYWSGKRERTPSPSAGKADLERMRRLFFSGDYARGEAEAGRLLQPVKGNFGTNLQVCELKIDHAHVLAEERPYARELSLEDAVARSEWRAEGAVFRSESFASHADGIAVSRIRSDRPGAVSFLLGLEGRTETFEARTDGAAAIVFAGRATERVHSDGECGVSCRGAVRIAVRGGAVRADGDRLVVEGADEAWIWLALDTDYEREGEEWAAAAEKRLRLALDKGYDRVREDHIRDYRSLYGRVELRLSGSGNDSGSDAEVERASLPTDERIRLLRSGAGEDPQLYALFYQYGRYLTIAGSRADSPLPLHLQGIWNDGEANRMAWSCDYHLDVNTEMNYYPAESGNLGECQLPLVRFVSRLAEAGRETARDFYGCEGWVAHVFTNAWGFTAPGWHYSWGMNVTGGLWIAAQLRERYEFGLDREYLERVAYPVLKEAALFFLDYMTVHPKYGWLVTGPANSPENSFFAEAAGSAQHHLSMGPTMDQTLVRELFEFCLAAARTLETDPELRDRLDQALKLLPPLQVGARGQLQEWLEDYGEAQPDHRHLSHLYGLYPGRAITPDATPELAAAARTSLETRKRSQGLEDVEFTLALFASGFARLRDGDEALTHLAYLIGELSYDNLFTFSKSGIAGAETRIFVADGNFGGAAAIAEMLVQGHAGFVELLPALPGQWRSGRVLGLRVKGGLEVDIRWQDGELSEAEIKAFASGATEVRFRDRSVSLTFARGERIVLDRELRLTKAAAL